MQKKTCWHTTLLAKCSVLYLLAWLTGETGCGAVCAPLAPAGKPADFLWMGMNKKSGWFQRTAAGIWTPVPRLTLWLVVNMTRSCGHTPEKIAGQRATVKAEMNGLTPGLDRRPPSRWISRQGGQSLKALDRTLFHFGAFFFSKLKWAESYFVALLFP